VGSVLYIEAARSFGLRRSPASGTLVPRDRHPFAPQGQRFDAAVLRGGVGDAQTVAEFLSAQIIH
jgi:hypothetical protein